MNECLLLMRTMIAKNAFAIMQSPAMSGKLMVETLEADEEGTLWCWADEEDMTDHLQSTEVAMKFADKKSGQYMVVKGLATTANFFPQNMAHLCRKAKSGYLLKVEVREVETFQKRQLHRSINIMDSVRKYSTAILQNMVRKQAV